MKVAGIILAGGLARRMGGGDKCLRLLRGRPILAHIVERLAPQVEALALNANGDPSRFASFGLPVTPDSIAGFPGPLAGVLAGLDWAADRVPGVTHVASLPADSPFVPADFVARLAVSLESAGGLACAASGGRTQPVCALWPVGLAGPLRDAIVSQGMAKVGMFAARYPLRVVEFSTEPFDPFFNTNRPEDLAEAERLLTAEYLP